jgi:OPA family glycerol-3-phosphate transporter-like MFS transporter
MTIRLSPQGRRPDYLDRFSHSQATSRLLRNGRRTRLHTIAKAFRTDLKYIASMPNIAALFRPVPHATRLPASTVQKLYPRFRWQILESTFIGYAVFYLVRNNLPVVSKEMGQALHYSKGQIGDMLALTAISYGIGKFLLGAVSDRSNPRYFMPAGLLLTALCNFLFGGISNYYAHLVLWTLNGFFQGMGWPPCGRSLGHWYSLRERGTVFAFWNVAHNVGGGLTGVIAAYSTAWMGWRYAFYVPGILAVICAFYLILRLRDTPQSVGLPPIEEYKNDYPVAAGARDLERELGTRELLFRYILNNKYLWLFAAANFFVYIARYSMLDWGPTYLKEVKRASLEDGGFSTAVFEFAGIFSTILMGWLSDKAGGRRGMVSMLCMVPVFIAFGGILCTPPGMLWLDLSLFAVVGFFIYPPVMLLGVTGLDFTSKKAVGAGAGFIGLFGYLGRTAQGKLLGLIAERHGWNSAFYFILGATLAGMVILSVTWSLSPKMSGEKATVADAIGVSGHSTK